MPLALALSFAKLTKRGGKSGRKAKKLSCRCKIFGQGAFKE
jgi:hypothetical protein